MQILLGSGDGEGAARVARAATERYSQSVASWSLCLQMFMQLEGVDMSELFQEALTHINPKVNTAVRQEDSRVSEDSEEFQMSLRGV